MKRLLTATVVIAMVLALGGLGMAQAATIFSDHTDIQQWNTGANPSATTTWTDILGENFQTYGGKLDVNNGQVYLYLYTKFGPADVTFSAAGKTIVPADIFFDTNLLDDVRNYDMAIRLRETGQGNIYTGLTESNITTSANIMTGSGTGWAFGGRFFDADTPVPVEVNEGVSSLVQTTVTWSDLGNFTLGDQQLTDVYEISILLSGIAGFNPGAGFSFVWGTGTCGNDAIEYGVAPGAAPLPASVLLMGSGLLGLGLLGFRRRKRNL
jgi:hypothetical protein